MQVEGRISGTGSPPQQKKQGWFRRRSDASKKSKSVEKMESSVDLQVGKTLWEDVPREMRTEFWLSILARNGRGTALGSMYMKLQTAAVPDDVVETIKKDISRSFPGHEFFRVQEHQDALFRLLRAYAAYDPEIGYCQGMNFIGAVLLLHLQTRESDAFATMVVLMQERGLRGHYTHDMKMLQVRLWQMGELMPGHLKEHLERNGVITALYASAWFLTVFASEFPISFVGRMMDILLSATDASVLMKVALCIMSELEPDLLEVHDMETILYFIKTAPPNWAKERLRAVLSDALNTNWDCEELEMFSPEVEKRAETVKESVDRTFKMREEAASGPQTETEPISLQPNDEPAAPKSAAPTNIATVPCLRTALELNPIQDGLAVQNVGPQSLDVSSVLGNLSNSSDHGDGTGRVSGGISSLAGKDPFGLAGSSLQKQRSLNSTARGIAKAIATPMSPSNGTGDSPIRWSNHGECSEAGSLNGSARNPSDRFSLRERVSAVSGGVSSPGLGLGREPEPRTPLAQAHPAVALWDSPARDFSASSPNTTPSKSSLASAIRDSLATDIRRLNTLCGVGAIGGLRTSSAAFASGSSVSWSGSASEGGSSDASPDSKLRASSDGDEPQGEVFMGQMFPLRVRKPGQPTGVSGRAGAPVAPSIAKDNSSEAFMYSGWLSSAR